MEEGKCCSNRLSVCGFALAGGITYALSVLFLGMMSMHYQMGTPMVDLLGSMYKGFNATLMGSFVGAGWAFLDGLVCSLVFAIVYNIVKKCCPCKSCKSTR